MKASPRLPPHLETVAAIVRRPHTSIVDVFVGGTLQESVELPYWPPALKWIEAIERQIDRLVETTKHGPS